MADVREVNPDLVGAPGLEVGLHQGHRTEPGMPQAPQRLDPRAGELPAVAHHHPTLALGGQVLVQRKAQPLGRAGPVAEDQRQVALADPPLAHRLVHRGERRTSASDQQHPRGLPIDPVDELEHPLVRPGRSHLLDHPEAHAAAAVDGDPGGLVDRQQQVVLPEQREVLRRRRRGRAQGRRAHRRDPHDLADRQPVVGRDTAPIDPDLPAAHDPVDVALRYALEQGQQEVVQALPGMRLVDENPPHIGRRLPRRRRWRLRFCR